MSTTVNTTNTTKHHFNQNQPVSLPSFLMSAKESLRFSLPLILASVVNIASPFMGTLMIAHLGANELAAIGLGSAIYITVLVFFYGVISATGVLVSHHFGANNKGKIGLVVQQGFWVAITFGIPLLLVLWFMPALLPLSGQKGEVLRLADEYMRSICWSMVPLIFICIMHQFLIGIGRTRLVLWISILQIPCEVLTMYMFIYGKFGAPACGVAGIAYGIIVVFMIAVIAIWLYLRFNSNFAPYNLFKWGITFHREYFCEIIRVGLPIAFAYAVEVCLFAALSFFMGRLGRDTLAAHQIALQYLDVAATMIFALAQSTATRIGHLVGVQDRLGIARVLHVDMVMGAFLMLIIACLYWAFPHFLIGLDLGKHTAHHVAITRYAVSFMAIAGIYLIIDSARWVVTGGLRALKDTKAPMYLGGVIFWFLVMPLSYYCGLIWGFGGVGIWWALTAGTALITAGLYMRFVRILQHIDLTALL
jgi:multidrug resistance protein, MATE family